MFRVPRKTTIMKTVQTPSGRLPRRRWLAGLRCGHHVMETAIIIDHSPGPGWMSDAWHVGVCQGCGKILEKRQVY